MASVLGMLEEREAAARVRVEGLREEAARLAGVLEAAEIELDRRVIAREELVEALAVSAAETTAVTEAEQVAVPSPVPGSVVPPWRDGLPVTVLAPDCQRILGVLAARRSAGEGPVKAKEIAAELGLGTTSAKAEGGVRRPGAWRNAGGSSWKCRGCSVPAGGPWPCQTSAHPRDHRPPDHCLAAGRQLLVVPGQTARMHQPRERALCHPESGQHHEPRHVVSAFYALQGQRKFVPTSVDERAGVAAVGPDEGCRDAGGAAAAAGPWRRPGRRCSRR
ncbi:hypothetical protein YUMDRAFT_06373 [Streptomyces sp. OspMP-M45]|nr:hypothetical protein YUMDRAFT_06373 [Streptomyces sp. OspMP-M45]